MNLTDFRDNALLKLQVGGPFTGGMIDLTNQEYILIQVEQTEQAGQRRRRTQQVRASVRYIFCCVICAVLISETHLSSEQVIHNWTVPLHSERSDQILVTKTFEMVSRYSERSVTLC